MKKHPLILGALAIAIAVAGIHAQSTPGRAEPPHDFSYHHSKRHSDSRDGGHARACASTQTGILSGTLVIDGYQTQVGDLVLLVAQTDARQNGLWKVSLGAWVRESWYSSAPVTGHGRYQIAPGLEVYIEHGDTWADCYWHLAMPEPGLAGSASIIVDTTPTTWDVRKTPEPNCDVHSMTLAAGDPLPATVPDGTDVLLIDVADLDEDLDLSAWKPEGLAPCAKIRIRKVDRSPGRIVFDDGVCRYNHANKKGEFLCLLCDGAALHVF